MENIVSTTTSVSSSPSYFFLGLSILGFMSLGTFFSYRKFIALKNLRDLEYKKFNENCDLVINNYERYNENLELKKYLIMKKNVLKEIIGISDVKNKWDSSFILQNNKNLQILYKKLNLLDLKIKENSQQIGLTKTEIGIIESELGSTFENLNARFDINFGNNSNIDIKEQFQLNLETISLVLNEAPDIVDWLTSKFDKYVIMKDFSIKMNNFLESKNEILFQKYEDLLQHFMHDTDTLLKAHIDLINTKIKFIDIEEAKFLEIYEEDLPFLKLYKIPKKVIEDEYYEILLCKDKHQTYEHIYNKPDLLKNMLWAEHEENHLYLDSYNTYFWFCYDIFWNDIKFKTLTILHKYPLILNFIDTPPSVPAFQLSHIDHFELNIFYLKLQFFALQIFLVQHIDYLKFLIPIGYFGVILIISYFLYKKIKFWYNCYKTKTVKTTFLNWLFDPEILFTTSKLGLFYSVAIIVLLGGLYYFSGFGYWFTFIFCGRVFLWNWTKYFINKLNKKYIFYATKL